MAYTDTTVALAAQIQKFWSPTLMKELREETLLPSLVNREYKGDIKKGGNTVQVSQITKAAGERKVIGTTTDWNTFTPEAMVTKSVDVKADQIITASFEFDDLMELQTQLHAEDSGIRDALAQGVKEQLNDYLYSLIAPASGNIVPSIAAITPTEVKFARKRAGLEKWLKDNRWYGLLDPNYYSDLLDQEKFASSDYVSDPVTISGQIAQNRYGFKLFEDNSVALEQGLFFHPDFMYLVMQKELEFKVSDLHANNKHGFLISASIVAGAKLGIDGANKHIVVKATA